MAWCRCRYATSGVEQRREEVSGCVRSWSARSTRTAEVHGEDRWRTQPLCRSISEQRTLRNRLSAAHPVRLAPLCEGCLASRLVPRRDRRRRRVLRHFRACVLPASGVWPFRRETKCDFVRAPAAWRDTAPRKEKPEPAWTWMEISKDCAARNARTRRVRSGHARRLPRKPRARRTEHNRVRAQWSLWEMSSGPHEFAREGTQRRERPHDNTQLLLARARAAGENSMVESSLECSAKLPKPWH